MRGATARSAMQPRLIAERPKANLPTSGVCAPLDPERTPALAQLDPPRSEQARGTEERKTRLAQIDRRLHESPWLGQQLVRA